jgi:hypothetical protein
MLTHPVFKLELRRVLWAQSAARLQRRTMRAFASVFFALISLWLLYIYNGHVRASAAGAYLTSEFMIGTLLALSLLANAILDSVSLFGVLSSISSEIKAGRWDLLRLTSVSEHEIVAAKHSVAQVRVWRTMTIIASLRITAFALLMLHSTFLPQSTLENSTVLDTVQDFFRNDPIAMLFGLATFALFWLICIVEPLWRMRAMTALGLAISARVQQVTFAGLAGAVAILTVWVIQYLVLMSVIGTLFWLAVQLIQPPLMSTAVMALLFCMCLVIAFVVYVFYLRLREWSLRRALRYAFAD